MPIRVKQLHPLFVGEVDGVDLSTTLSEEAVATIAGALDRYAVVVFHGQKLDDDQLLALGKRFGPISAPRNPRSDHRLKHAAIADISNLDNTNALRGRDDHRRLDALGNQLWHSDASFRPVAGAISMLYAHIVPPRGGETEFADLRAAYDDLDEEMKALVGDLVAEHSIFQSRGLLGYTDYTPAERQALPSVHHPLVRTQPGSKRKSLYMGAHASHIVGMPVPEGKLLLSDLRDHATDRRYVHTHAWTVGDLVMWDNRCTLHRGRRYDDTRHKRDLRRVTTQDADAAAKPVGTAAAAS